MAASKNPLVSCIIIFLNGEPFISETINSVFAQSYDNWELLLVDDGSTDNSTRIAQEYAQKYPEKVRYLEHAQHENKGMSATRNLGIANAKGEYVAFLDADDFWLPQKLAEQVAILEAHPEIAMVYGHILFWFSWTGQPGDSQRDFFMDLGVLPDTVIQPPKLLPLLWEFKAQPPIHTDTLFRRSIFMDIGLCEENFRSYHEDSVFFTKLALKAPVFVADKCWSRYRQHEHSSQAQIKAQGNRIAHTRAFFNWAENYLKEQGQKGTGIWRTLKKNQLVYCHPFLYFLRFGFLEFLMAMSRKILPVAVRHYLWLKLGSRLYGQRINNSSSG